MLASFKFSLGHLMMKYKKIDIYTLNRITMRSLCFFKFRYCNSLANRRWITFCSHQNFNCILRVQAGRKDPSESLDMALVHLGHKTRDLRRNLRRAVVDHISDAFLDTQVPLLMLLDAAKRGDQQGVEDCGQLFLQHAARLCEVKF